jgi:hypothetical protein
MKRSTDEEILARLLEQKRKLQERANKIHARVRKQERAAETRQKILLGAFLREWMERDPEMKRKATVGLERYLTRDIDRQHFDLALRGDGTIKATFTAEEDEPEQKKAS